MQQADTCCCLRLTAAPAVHADNEGFPSLRGSSPLPPDPAAQDGQSPAAAAERPAPKPEFFETNEFYFKLPEALEYAPAEPTPGTPSSEG